MKPYFQNDKVTLYLGNCCEIMPLLSGFTAIVTDPPYELGFMGKSWDKSEVGFDLGTWWIALNCCLPGAHLLSFGGSRTFHRIASAIENAGWEIRDTLMWLYGSGFPKSLNVSKAIAKVEDPESEFPVETDAAKLWNGYGTALKPAFEPIVLARKPLCGTVVENVAKHGCGALAIDACRAKGVKGVYRPNNGDTKSIYHGCFGDRSSTGETTTKGRWPASILHDGSEEVVREFPNVTTGNVKPYTNKSKDNDLQFNTCSINTGSHVGDSGSASRFFYCAKASGDEREDNTHATVKPLALMEYLCRLIKQPERNLVLDPFSGSGTTLLACELLGIPCVGIELDEGHCEIIAKRFSKPAEPFLI